MMKRVIDFRVQPESGVQAENAACISIDEVHFGAPELKRQ